MKARSLVSMDTVFDSSSHSQSELQTGEPDVCYFLVFPRSLL